MKCVQRWLGGVVASLAVLAAQAVSAADWPQFRGPQRDGICQETGLLKQWPKEGPKLLWKIQGLGRGYSTVSIVGNKLYTMGDRKLPQGGEGQFVLAYDLATRKEIWATQIGPPHGDGGPRCAPTMDGDSLYVIGTNGDLVCLETTTGKEQWKKNLESDFGGRMMSGWRYSESPLIDGNKVVCTPGGKDATLVALDKKSGEPIWKCAVPDLGPKGSDGAGYSSIVAADIDGVRQYIQILGRGAVGVDAESGKFLWGYNKIANRVANIPSPVVKGNQVFVTTSYETGSALLNIVRDGKGFKAQEVYFLNYRDFENHHGGVVLVGDHVYGGSLRNKGVPTCVEFKSGKIVWKEKELARGSAAVLYADGHLYFRYEDSTVALIEATPEEFRLKGKFTAPVTGDRKSAAGPAWPYPVICEGKLYLRHGDTLMCYDISEK